MLLGFSAMLGMGCATFGRKQPTAGAGDADGSASAGHVDVAMPRDADAVRDNHSAPILKVGMVGNVTFPYVYGYPIYPEGDAARGISALRADNSAGAKREDDEDDAGVVHATEELPRLGCRFDGIRESAAKYVPLSLTCDLPAPRSLGGSKRPVLGSLGVNAKADQILHDPSVEEAFLGAFHLTSEGFSSGTGIGYFNTTHGQLALVFAHRRLTRFVYYFDPGVKGWQNPALWVRP